MRGRQSRYPGDRVNNEEQILDVLRQSLELQRQALANQQQAIAQQQVALQRQVSHLRLYKGVLLVTVPIVGYLVYIFLKLLPYAH
jgi:hypothetical protein